MWKGFLGSILSQASIRSGHGSMDESYLYEQHLQQMVQLIEQKGFRRYRFGRRVPHCGAEIEDKIYEREGLDQMVITMLQMRRREKDYLLRGDQQYVENVSDLVVQLKIRCNSF